MFAILMSNVPVCTSPCIAEDSDERFDWVDIGFTPFIVPDSVAPELWPVGGGVPRANGELIVCVNVCTYTLSSQISFFSICVTFSTAVH